MVVFIAVLLRIQIINLAPGHMRHSKSLCVFAPGRLLVEWFYMLYFDSCDVALDFLTFVFSEGNKCITNFMIILIIFTPTLLSALNKFILLWFKD